MNRPDVLTLRPEGLYCPAGDFYIDPFRPVDRAIITHGHSDHARWGHKSYLCAPTSESILRARLGEDLSIRTLPFGERLNIGGASISLHPAGHLLGSAQVRVEVGGEVWAFSGDYKIEPDATAEPFEPVRCHTFVTETTFGLPIFHWKPSSEVAESIANWWRENQRKGLASVLFGYALGKAQRLLASLPEGVGPIVAHGAVRRMNEAYAAGGVDLPETISGFDLPKSEAPRAMILAPPSAQGTPWMRRFGGHHTGFASGWMAVRGHRRRRAIDRGFVLSDHVDWHGLLTAVAETGAERVLTTHGYSESAARYFRERGLAARALGALFQGEESEEREEADEAVS